jgi:hypothetical protein
VAEGRSCSDLVEEFWFWHRWRLAHTLSDSLFRS